MHFFNSTKLLGIRFVSALRSNAQLSTLIPLDKMPDQIKRQHDEIQRNKAEIQKVGAILEEKNVDIQTIDEYKSLEEKLGEYGLSM